MDFNSFKDDFGAWANKFRPFIESEDMYNIYQRLKSDSLNGEIITPHSDSTFRAFKLTNPELIKVIFYVQDPYPKRYSKTTYQATGIGLDCSTTPDGKLQPSLIKFYDAMSKELGHKVEYSPNLEYLGEQGVLMLNTDLTCKLNKPNSHEGLWEPFQKYFLTEIMSSNSGIIYVLCGKQSHRMERYILPVGNYIIKLDYPSALKSMDWNSNGVFQKINKILHQNSRFNILWDKKEWQQEIDSLPF